MNERVVGVPMKPETLANKGAGLFAERTTIYSCIVLVAALASYAFWMHRYSIFACQADGYSADRYVAYCNATGYGDYEHGAFWFGLEPSAQRFAKDADVVFLGNSHAQYGFSTKATADWFSEASIPYYQLGFTYYEGVSFAEALMRRIQPKAKVYVINLDDFFTQWESPPAMEVMNDPGARSHYEAKRLWQRAHERICKLASFFCGKNYAIFRSRQTGAYSMSRGNVLFEAKPVSYDQTTREDVVKTNTAAARKFLSDLPVQEECVILTIVPTVETKTGNANAIAGALHKDLVTPEVQGLQTFDGSHLDPPSAQRWSEAFFQAAGPQIRSCLGKQDATHS
jgi:hypothetical protein